MMLIMRKTASKRARSKQESLDRILDAAARRLREEGLDGAAIVPVMRDADLTHGTFY
jgi:TetR/AcrR family transcriptional repressor of nem operon